MIQWCVYVVCREGKEHLIYSKEPSFIRVWDSMIRYDI